MRPISLSFLLLFSLSAFNLQANHDPEKKPKTTVNDDAAYAKLVVYRPWKYVSMLAPLHLHVDKKVRLSLPNNAKDTLYLAPGTYTLKRKTGDGWPEKIQVEAGKTYFVRISASLLGGQMDIIDPNIALQELSFHSYRKRGRLKVKPVTRIRLN